MSCRMHNLDFCRFQNCFAVLQISFGLRFDILGIGLPTNYIALPLCEFKTDQEM